MNSEVETHNTRMNVDRFFARGFVILGGAFWMVASFAALYAYVGASASSALLAAFLPFAATAATLVVGWYYERSVAALLALGSLAVVVWGVVAGWEVGVWILMAIFMVGPMMTAATLFMLARREQVAFELAMAERTELAPVSVGAQRS